jgi:hypothetical protein
MEKVTFTPLARAGIESSAVFTVSALEFQGIHGEAIPLYRDEKIGGNLKEK